MGRYGFREKGSEWVAPVALGTLSVDGRQVAAAVERPKAVSTQSIPVARSQCSLSCSYPTGMDIACTRQAHLVSCSGHL
jgi:hypothetical protein